MEKSLAFLPTAGLAGLGVPLCLGTDYSKAGLSATKYDSSLLPVLLNIPH